MPTKKLTIGSKLTLTICGSLAVSLTILGVLVVLEFGSLMRQLTYTGAQEVVGGEAAELREFFVQRGRVATTMLANPHLRRWFTDYNQFRAPIADDPDYRLIIDYFDRIVADDPQIIQAFFATENTQEYFRADDGRIERDGYFVKQREWWREAVTRDRLYVTSPHVSASTGDITVVIQTTVYHEDGSLFGVGGVDLSLDIFGDVVEAMRFRDDVGRAFLVNDKGALIHFAGIDLDLDTSQERPVVELASLDDSEPDTNGFAELTRAYQAGDLSAKKVVLEGERSIVLSAPVQTDSPELHWTLGLVVPERVISAPIRRMMLISALAILGAIVGISWLTLSSSNAVVVKPLRELVNRFKDVAEGDGDLTRRVEITREDEIGELGRIFNSFLELLQSDIRSVGSNAQSLTSSSDTLQVLGEQLASTTEETSAQANFVSDASDDVSAHIQTVATATEQMNASALEIARLSRQAAEVAANGVDIAADSRQTFEKLGKSSATIGKVVEVISSIAEQTNLLALNATIEAARAGESGRGFAVVASEVKNLASETGTATGEISSTIATLQGDAHVATEAIERISEIIKDISEIQTTIACAVEEQTATTAEIMSSANAAARTSSEISANTTGTAEALQEMASAAAVSHDAANELAKAALELAAIVGRFSY